MKTFLFIFFISLTLNYLVQLGYYFWRKAKNPKAFAGKRSLLNYYTGFLGDGIVVPLMNVLIYYVIVNAYYFPTLSDLIAAIIIGILLDILIHYLQGKFKQTNWSMPRPFVWNFAGHWHMISFPIQMSFIALFFIILWEKSNFILGEVSTKFATLGAFGLMLLFGILFTIDNR